MLVSQIFAWVSLAFCLIEILRFAARVSGVRALNRFFHKLHIPCGILMLVFGAAHGLLAGNFPDASGNDIVLAPVLFTLNFGSVCFLFTILLALSYLLRKRLGKRWMPAHRLLTVCLAALLIFHLADVGIHLPERWSAEARESVSKAPVSSATEQPVSSKPTASSASERETPAPSDTPSPAPVSEGPISESSVPEPESSEPAFPETGLADGVYTGSAQGRNGPITVSVTVSNGQVTEIQVVDHTETPRYFSRAEEVIGLILSSQSTQVDAITGATISSEGIKDAVADALGW